MNFVYLIYNYCFKSHIFRPQYLRSEISEIRSEKYYVTEILLKSCVACVGQLQLRLWETGWKKKH